jgi:hypothetical protein
MAATWRGALKIRRFVAFTLSLFLVSCGPSLPKNYGVYAVGNQGLVQLSGQQVMLRGSLLNAIGGIEGPSGPQCRKLDSFIVFKQDMKADSIKVARVEFQSQVTVRDIFAARTVDVNLWVPSKTIDMGVKPVEGHTDMFYVTPSLPLNNGLYVLYFNSFGSIGDPSANTAYDVVVGDAKDYPSYATRIGQEQHEMRVKAEALLATMNQVFNQEDFPALKDIYRPNGIALSGDELRAFTDGMRTWKETSGKVESSKIVSEKFLDNGDLGAFELETAYEKSGVQREELQIRKFGNEFFVTSLK